MVESGNCLIKRRAFRLSPTRRANLEDCLVTKFLAMTVNSLFRQPHLIYVEGSTASSVAYDYNDSLTGNSILLHFSIHSKIPPATWAISYPCLSKNEEAYFERSPE
jgi:hypothetical protein